MTTPENLSRAFAGLSSTVETSGRDVRILGRAELAAIANPSPLIDGPAVA